MTSVVVDSSAVLAFLQHEPGSDDVASLLNGAAISTVNFTEVLTRLIDGSRTEQEALAMVSTLPLRVRPFDEVQATSAGLLRQATRALGLSLGDRACLALARAEGLPVLTADRAWASLAVGVEIRMIR